MSEHQIPDELKLRSDFYSAGLSIKLPEYSEWTCHLFGDVAGLTYRPLKGKEPNWFWRTTQYLILGHKWVKEQDDDN